MEFYYGSYHELTSNKIMGAMFSHIDGEGHNFQILSNITDHKSDGNAIYTSDGFTESRDGKIFTQEYHGWMETTSGVEG